MKALSQNQRAYFQIVVIIIACFVFVGSMSWAMAIRENTIYQRGVIVGRTDIASGRVVGKLVVTDDGTTAWDWKEKEK